MRSVLVSRCQFCFFFFKQKTAYEMRISDWSSDVCSSDLMIGASDVETLAIERFEARGMPMGEDSIETVIWTGRFVQAWRDPASVRMVKRREVKSHLCGSARAKDPNVRQALIDPVRSEESRVGKECVSTCRSRGSPDH